MKPFFSLVAAALFFSFLASRLQADLTIVQRVEGMGQNMETTAMFKGDKTRVDAAPNTSIIMDLKTGEITQFSSAQKTYLKVPAQVAQAAMDSVKKMQGDAKEKPQFKPTGKKDTINSFAAEEYSCTIAGSTRTMWLTKSLPDYAQALKEMSAALNQGPLAAMMQNYGVDLATLPGFPVRMVNEIQPGQTVTTTVVSVNTKPIADSEFDVPAGYKEMKMPTLTPPADAAAPAK